LQPKSTILWKSLLVLKKYLRQDKEGRNSAHRPSSPGRLSALHFWPRGSANKLEVRKSGDTRMDALKSASCRRKWHSEPNIFTENPAFYLAVPQNVWHRNYVNLAITWTVSERDNILASGIGSDWPPPYTVCSGLSVTSAYGSWSIWGWSIKKHLTARPTGQKMTVKMEVVSEWILENQKQ
jgi:hypothetical protein